MENEKIKAARKELGSFFEKRRQQMGRTLAEMATHLGISDAALKGVEKGRFPLDVDLLFAICAALEIKPFFTPLEELGGGSIENVDAKEKFLLDPSKETNQLYILHRQCPACLVQIVQTTPVTFRIVDLYDDISEEDLAVHPFLEDAKLFFYNQVQSGDDKN